MTFTNRLFRAGMAALAGLATLSASGLAQAQTVENVATATWQDGDRTITVESNRVSFDIAPASQARLTTFVPLPGAGQPVGLEASYCTNSQGSAVPSIVGPGSGPDTNIAPTETLRVGQTLVVRIDAAAANTNSAAKDRLSLRVTAPHGDVERLTAVESDVDSGIFYATVATIPFPPPFSAGDCRLSLQNGDTVDISAFVAGRDTPFLIGAVDVLADPFGLVFDSLDGRPVDGARVTIVDAVTGQPAQVFSFDGVTPWPSTVITGTSVTDGSGLTFDLLPGEYRFPLVAFGNYRLRVEPPSPYTAPSDAPPGQIANLTDPQGQPFDISDASYGGVFAVDSPIPVRVDIPVDSPGGDVTIIKTASRDIAEPGDAIFYTVNVRNNDRSRPTSELTLTDDASFGLRLRAESVRIDGEPSPEGALTPAADGRGFSLFLGRLGAGETRRVTYAMGVRDDAPVGEALNRAVVTSPGADPVETEANVRIQRRSIAERMTIIGRVVDGACGRPEDARGIPGVRVMLEDGSFAITDYEGRYHFEGVVPGNHVVQVSRYTLPEGGEFVECVQSSRSQGSAISRLVTGQGGSLVRADFHAMLPEGTQLAEAPADPLESLGNVEASGADIDFVAEGDGPDGFLFPAEEYNPRAPSVRVAIRHRAGQKVRLTANGQEVDPLSFDGVKTSGDKTYAVSVWRSIILEGPDTMLRAEIQDKDGTVAGQFQRNVHYAKIPMRAEVVLEESRLIADGSTPPVLALRMTDRFGKPVHAGVAGRLELASPYQAKSAIAAQQNAELTGFGDTSASWLVEGDQGIAYIELAPTMISGALRATFEFSDGETVREQEIETWIEPGDAPWTLIGLAEGSIGARTVADNMERDGNFDSHLGDNARVAFYAKGRVLGKYLLTLAYDSAKQEEDQRLLGTIDPSAYYTVFGDNSQRFFDAASRDKIYVRVESSTFYALYGDFETGFDQTYLARYQRIATGVKAEARIGQVQVEGFAANIGSRHRRIELQGAGISGPYQLGTRGIIPNSETVILETRDRLRSEIIVEQRELVRFVDYNIDILSGTITFAQPVLSRDASLNPQFIVVDYDVDRLGEQEWNAGARATWTSNDGRIRIGATGITDKGDEERTTLGAIDARIRVGNATEIRAEAALSEGTNGSAKALMAEVEHHSGNLDLLAYARQVDEDYGVGQQNVAERGRRKLGADARLRISDALSVVASAWHDESLIDDSARDALEVRAAWQTDDTDAFVGIAHLSDTLSDGTKGDSTVLQAGATQRLLDKRLELTGATSVALGGTDSIDLPTQHSLGVRYAITPDIKALATYEIARGDAIDANTLKFGAEVTPWEGGRLIGALGRDTIGRDTLETDSDRTFAALSLGHSFKIGERLILDATIDTNQTLSGSISPLGVVNPAQPVSSGGQFGPGGTIGEDFAAITLGAAWGVGPWNARMRGEYRDGEFADRMGATLAIIRKLGEGSVVGTGVNWTKADAVLGGSAQILDAAVSIAHRPEDSAFAFIGKLEYRSDSIENAFEGGDVGAAGQTALITAGDASARRLLASVSANWRPQDDENSNSTTEVGVFLGVRHNFDRLDGFDLTGTSLLGGLDARLGLTDMFEVGGRANVRHDLETGTTLFSIGPEVGVVPTKNVLVSVGYNVVGFRDPDYSASRFTDEGVFASIRIKFDDDFLGGLLGNRR
ncbi:hypothetical protein [Qipengyuania sp. JC766]|uniref:hypothetical protein n=1 Tax=Qipengyuania sp. JC766 TaxID=3232139 RepID=UPI003459CB11